MTGAMTLCLLGLGCGLSFGRFLEACIGRSLSWTDQERWCRGLWEGCHGLKHHFQTFFWNTRLKIGWYEKEMRGSLEKKLKSLVCLKCSELKRCQRRALPRGLRREASFLCAAARRLTSWSAHFCRCTSGLGGAALFGRRFLDAIGRFLNQCGALVSLLGVYKTSPKQQSS